MIRQRKLPLLVYDGECSFCRLWIDRWKQITGDRVEYQPYQEVADQFPDIAREAFAGSVHLITPEGSVFNHAHAVFRSLSYVPGRRWMLWLYEKIPFFAPISEACYGFVAKHRNGFYRITLLLWENDPHQSHILTRWVFLRFIGLIYLIAFASLGVQILGLIGKDGILPAGSFLHAVKEHFREGLYWQFPTLAWFDATDAFLQFLCWGGAGLSLLLVFGVVPRVAAGLLWIFYLSLFIVGQAFLSFQWDILLLETGFLTIFLAPLQLLPN